MAAWLDATGPVRAEQSRMTVQDGLSDVRGALTVRRSRGIHRGWALGEILRHGHRTGGVDGISYLDYLSRKGAGEESEAAATIIAYIRLVPELDPGAYAAELDRVLALIEGET